MSSGVDRARPAGDPLCDDPAGDLLPLFSPCIRLLAPGEGVLACDLNDELLEVDLSGETNALDCAFKEEIEEVRVGLLWPCLVTSSLNC